MASSKIKTSAASTMGGTSSNKSSGASCHSGLPWQGKPTGDIMMTFTVKRSKALMQQIINGLTTLCNELSKR